MPTEAQEELQIVPTHRDYLSIIFRRCVLALAGARVPENTVFERRMLEQVVELAEQYFTNLIAYMERISHMQRRRNASMADVALLLHFNELNVLDLIAEAQRTPEIEESKPVMTLNNLYFDPEEASLDPLQAPFFESPKQLVKQKKSRLPYMPQWMPSLPPEHTYMHTPSHSSQVRDLRTVRMSLVEEGRLAEQALQRLLGDRGSSSVIELPKQGKAPQQSSMVVVDDHGSHEMDERDEGARSLAGDRSIDHDGMTVDGLSVSNEDAPKEGALEGGAPDGNASADLPQKDLFSPDGTPLPQTPQPETDGNRPGEMLRIQLHLGKPESPPKKLSLKLSLGKHKKRKDPSLLGKRPRANIVDLARSRAHKDDEKMAVEEEAAAKPAEDENQSNEGINELFAAALESYSR